MTSLITKLRTYQRQFQDQINRSKLAERLSKQTWFQWLLAKRNILLPGLAILALLCYGYLIRQELTVGENKGNIKIVATKSKDPKSNGFKENVRTNIIINGQNLNTDTIVRKEWEEYGAGIPIPIYTADASVTENQTLEIQHDEAIKQLSFEYSTYDVGGYLQIYVDDVLYTQINTYHDGLVYKPITLTFNQHYAVTKNNAIWWGQLALFLLLIIFWLTRLGKDKQNELTKPIKNSIQSVLLFIATLASLHLAFKFGDSQTFYFFNTQITPTKLPIFLICLLILSMVVKEYLPRLRSIKLQIIGQLTYLFINALAPFISLYLIETAYSIYSVSHLSSSDYQANILILLVIWVTLALLTTSIRAASIILVAGSMIVGIVTKILLISRNMPLLSYHFLQIRDGLSVAGETDFSFTSSMFSLIFICWFVIITLSFLPKFNQLFDLTLLAKATSKISWPKFLQNLSHLQKLFLQKVLVFALGVLSLLFVARPIIYSIANGVDLSLYFWTLQSTYYDHGLPVALTRYHLASQIKEPEGYSNSKVKEILAQYPKTQSTSKQSPNIVVILNESLADYTKLTPSLQFSSDPLEYIHSLSKNTVKGTMDVSVFAGSTANTEYEVLTSNSLAILPPNAFPFQQYISSEKNSIVNFLEAQNYATYAMHPYGKDNYRRSQVYGYLGFDTSYFENSIPAFKDLIENPERVRGYVSDYALYQGAEKLIQETDQPVFNFIATMQGHGGYNRTETEFPRTISITNAENDPSATDYLSSIDASDKAFESFTKSLENSDEPTIVVMFGDHEPILSDSYFKPYLNSSDPSSRYQTPFVIWANFELPQLDETTLSPNFLMPYTLEVLSQTDHALSVSSYYQFLAQVQKEIPVMTTWGYYDSSYTYSDTAPTSELYKQYQLVEYNNVIDKTSLQMTDYYQ
ncbi:LTA synthase family protein [Streptococcus caprae]|uniref:LTA synthase family protein n=1 Tax=Streptococcus caprae TaxID=1640501 RepID=A0ABV8CTX2_9STRE